MIWGILGWFGVFQHPHSSGPIYLFDFIASMTSRDSPDDDDVMIIDDDDYMDEHFESSKDKREVIVIYGGTFEIQDIRPESFLHPDVSLETGQILCQIQIQNIYFFVVYMKHDNIIYVRRLLQHNKGR